MNSTKKIWGAGDTELCGQFSQCFLAHKMIFLYLFCYICFLIRYGSYVRPNGQGFFSFYWQILYKSVIKFTYDMGFSGRHTCPRWEMAGKFLLNLFNFLLFFSNFLEILPKLFTFLWYFKKKSKFLYIIIIPSKFLNFL